TSLWTKKLLPSQTLISWPLNNHWDTNFPLQQEGVMTFTYGILLHDAYSPVVANRFGVEQNRPLIIIETDKKPIENPLLSVNNPRVMISSLKQSQNNKSVIVNLRSVSDAPEQVKITHNTNSSTVTVLPYGNAAVEIGFQRQASGAIPKSNHP
ncbi:MAG TPA: hypothetical protein VK616_10830, partial [Flavitalea sp.]|nr:hypothetical protein [Flavitalea sp.]